MSALTSVCAKLCGKGAAASAPVRPADLRMEAPPPEDQPAPLVPAPVDQPAPPAQPAAGGSQDDMFPWGADVPDPRATRVNRVVIPPEYFNKTGLKRAGKRDVITTQQRHSDPLPHNLPPQENIRGSLPAAMPSDEVRQMDPLAPYQRFGHDDPLTVRGYQAPEHTYEEWEALCTVDQPFVDPDFPADNTSLYNDVAVDDIKLEEKLQNELQNAPVTWRRPPEVLRDYDEDVANFARPLGGRHDVFQGFAADCWMIGALASLVSNPSYMDRIMPPNQPNMVGDPRYRGIYRFRFWRRGHWVEVFVDDRLPVYPNGRLLFARPTRYHGFWVALLEKAYAKLCGGYEYMLLGQQGEAFEVLTGGLTEAIKPESGYPNLQWEFVDTCFRQGALVGCGAHHVDEDDEEHAAMRNQTLWALGLRVKHAYSVTGTALVTTHAADPVKLVRVRDPYGHFCEREYHFQQDFANGNAMWNEVPDHEKDAIEYRHPPQEFDEKGLPLWDRLGEFWMKWSDFKFHWTRVEVCFKTPQSFKQLAQIPVNQQPGAPDPQAQPVDLTWNSQSHYGCWGPPETIGGGPHLGVDSFRHNDQYRLKLVPRRGVPENEPIDCIISLVMYTRRPRREIKPDYGFSIYDIPPQLVLTPGQISTEFPMRPAVLNAPARLTVYRDHSDTSVTRRIQLPPGAYCVVPHTHDADVEGSYLLRIFTPGITTREHKDGDNEKSETLPEFAHFTKYMDAEIENRMRLADLGGLFLDVLDARGVAHNAPQIIDHGDMVEILDTLREHYDHPPVERCVPPTRNATLMSVAKAVAHGRDGGYLNWYRVELARYLLILWTITFDEYCEGHREYIRAGKLREAATKCGYFVSSDLLRAVWLKFGDKLRHHQPLPSMRYENFIRAMAALEYNAYMSGLGRHAHWYNSQSPENNELGVMPRNELMLHAIYNHVPPRIPAAEEAPLG